MVGPVFDLFRLLARAPLPTMGETLRSGVGQGMVFCLGFIGMAGIDELPANIPERLAV